MSQIKYIKQNQAVTRGEENYKIQNYITKEFSSGVSLAVSELSGETSTTMNAVSDRIYYFLDGEAEFIFDDQIIKIEPNASLFIPKNTEYKMKGIFKAVLVNAPAFDIANEKKLYL